MKPEDRTSSKLALFGQKTRLFLILGTLFLLAVVISSWFAIKRIEVQIKGDVGNTLQTVLNTTHTAVKGWAEDRIKDARHFAQMSAMVRLIKEQLRLPSTKEALSDSTALKEMRKLIRPFLLDHNDLGFFVISPDKINIASMRDENLGELNLLARQYKYLEDIFKGNTQLVLPMRSDVPLPGVTGESAKYEPTMFVGAPVLDEDGSVIAAFTIRIDPSLQFTRITQMARSGETGDTYAFDKDGKLITESRFDKQLREVGLIESNERGILSLTLRDPGGNLLDGFIPKVEREKLPLTKMAQEALAGRHGFDVYGYRDYRGVPVVGAWLWDNNLNLGMIAKIDVVEAYKSLYAIRRIVISVLGITAIVFFSLSSVIIVRNRKLNDEIVERKQIEKALNIANKNLTIRAADLQAANEELSQYSYVVSHDLKAPLRAIQNYADFLNEDLESTLEEEQKKYLNNLTRAVRQSEELIDDLLELSQIGRNVGKLEKIDMNEFFEDLLEPSYLSQDVEVVMEKDWPTIEAEPLLLKQIFQNLITNAIKFNCSSRKRLELGWLRAGREHYEIFVCDNGIGIESAYYSQIFRMFQRLHTREKFDGSGIGLAIVKKASNKLRGSVRIESKLGEGSTFFVKLPKKRKEIKDEQ